MLGELGLKPKTPKLPRVFHSRVSAPFLSASQLQEVRGDAFFARLDLEKIRAQC